MPDAEILAVGSELLGTQRVDTNSLYLTGKLNVLGVEVVQKCVVGDDRARLANEIASALRRTEIVILSGGLGPTEDDITRDAVAAALGRTQYQDATALAAIEERFRRNNRKMAEINKRQAMVIEGAEVLPNPRGTAPGQWIRTEDGRTVMLLPGPPHELKGMFEDQVQPRLEAMLPKQCIETAFYRIAGMGESDVDALIAPVYSKYTNPVTTILAGAGDIQLHFRARCSTTEEAKSLLAEVCPQIEKLLGDRIYSNDGASLEETVVKLLRAKNGTVAVAESATGGGLGARITSVAGSSACFMGGFITYTNEMKEQLLGVSSEVIAEYTEVSEQVAVAMAKGVRDKTGVGYGVSVTGEAGPESGSGQPVGVFYVGVADERGAEARRYQFPGDRARLRQLGTQWALDMLRRRILSAG